MHLINTTSAAADQLLAAIVANVPPDVDRGRAVVAIPDGVLAAVGQSSSALFTVHPGGLVERYLELGTGTAEVTRWRAGAEVFRSLVTA